MPTWASSTATLCRPRTPVLWGRVRRPILNSAQVMVNQFLVSGLAKWGQSLPWRFSSPTATRARARALERPLERFLQAAPGQHPRRQRHDARAVLPSAAPPGARFQAAPADPDDAQEACCALPAATPTLEELADGCFQRVIDDPRLRGRPGARRHEARALLGKVYYDIVGHEDREAEHIAVARVELLYPFPETELIELIESYPNLERVMWVQEEPRNMGARAFMRRRMAEILPDGWPTTTWAAAARRPGRGATRPPTARAGAHRPRWRSTWMRPARAG